LRRATARMARRRSSPSTSFSSLCICARGVERSQDAPTPRRRRRSAALRTTVSGCGSSRFRGYRRAEWQRGPGGWRASDLCSRVCREGQAPGIEGWREIRSDSVFGRQGARPGHRGLSSAAGDRPGSCGEPAARPAAVILVTDAQQTEHTATTARAWDAIGEPGRLSRCS
jgi:hypothetical protein